MKEIEIYEQAISRWGGISQSDMMVEECAELIQALNKFKRAKGDENLSKCWDNILEEIADVEIMLNQMKVLFNRDGKEIQKWKEIKLERLKKRITEKTK